MSVKHGNMRQYHQHIRSSSNLTTITRFVSHFYITFSRNILLIEGNDASNSPPQHPQRPMLLNTTSTFLPPFCMVILAHQQAIYIASGPVGMPDSHPKWVFQVAIICFIPTWKVQGLSAILQVARAEPLLAFFAPLVQVLICGECRGKGNVHT